MNEFKLKELELATDNFSVTKVIGKGSHGIVYKGDLNGQLVAIKKQSLGLQKLKDNSKLENEAQIISSLGKNPSFINLLGISHDSYNNKLIVTEYMSNGTLHNSLHLPHDPKRLLTWPKRVQIALQVAKAVCFLHQSSPSIVHRDIKSCNVLFDANWNAKLSDFGLAVRLSTSDDDMFLNMLPAGTIGYLDPEYTIPSKLSTKIDVYSYGVLLLELISGRKVIDLDKTPSSIVEWAIPLINEGLTFKVCDERVQLPRLYMENVINDLLRLAASCVLPIETLRPSMSEIVAKLERKLVVRNGVGFGLSLNCLWEAILLSMKRVKLKLKVQGKVTSCSNGEDDDNTKGTLLVREILADFTFK